MTSLDQDPDRKRALQRARRLLALTSSPNAHEAASASRKFAELRDRHGFAEADLVEPANSGLFEVAVSSARYGGFQSEWKWRLVSDVAAIHDCEAAASRDERRRRVRLVGDRNDVREAELHFQLLYDLIRGEGEIVVARVFRGRPDLGVSAVGGYARSYLRGLVAAVTERLLEDRLGREPVDEGEEAAAVTVGGAQVASAPAAQDRVAAPVDPAAGALVPTSTSRVPRRARAPLGGRRGTAGGDRRERVHMGAFAEGYRRGQELVLPAVGY